MFTLVLGKVNESLWLIAAQTFFGNRDFKNELLVGLDQTRMTLKRFFFIDRSSLQLRHSCRMASMNGSL